jgi:cytochrome c5
VLIVLIGIHCRCSIESGMQKNTGLTIGILLLSGFLGFSVGLYRQHVPVVDNESAPTLIQTFHYPATFVKQLKGDPLAGEKIFTEFCASCHGKQPLIDIAAPHIGDKIAWAGRRRLSLEILLNITIKGAGAMPARGGCFECSDEQLRETIKYILRHS